MKGLKKLKETYSSNLNLTVKWTLLTSSFIFILFTIFAVITYKTSTSLIVAQEKENLEETMKQINKKLSKSDNDLTIRNTAYYLKDSKRTLYSNPSSETLEASLIQLNSFISELSQPDLTVMIFNSEKKLVFETKKLSGDYLGNKESRIKREEFGDRTGFVATAPIFSANEGKLIGYAQLFFDLSSAFAIRSQLLIRMITLITIGVFISLVLGFFLASYFLRPLKAITQTINVIKGDPQTDLRLPVLTTKDEFADLSEVFNVMMDRMQKFIEQQQLFVEDVSHELRTPVAIIEGHLKLLNRWGKDDPEILEESLQASLQEIVRMKSLVQEMLDLSRVEQVEFQHKNDVSLAKEVIHQTFNNFQILYEDFTFIMDDDLRQEKTVKIYRNHFEQLLIILLDNAVKYSRERKEIHLSVSTTQKELEIVIQDFGEGIAEEDLEQIFNRFYRVDKARSRHKGGNGLGLAIAKELVDSYGGRILVESAVNVGTVFRIFLPIELSI